MNQKVSFLKSSLNEECGIAAVWDSKSQDSITHEHLQDAARSVFYALFSLQHRGQEAAGIAVSNGKHIHLFKKPGLVSNVFTENDIANLQGDAAIGHTRYSTTGSSSIGNIQPFYIETIYGPIALAHNGNLVNALDLRNKLLKNGVGLSSTSDTEVMIMMLAASKGNSWGERIALCMSEWKGAFSIAVLTTEGIYVARDPWGFRPLCVGSIQHGISVAASESCAMLTLGCDNFFEVKPGEVLKLNTQGAELCAKIPPQKTLSPCIFEYVYFARPDSIWNNASVHTARVNFGKELAKIAPVDADIVIAIPDSSRSAAIGYSQESGIPYDEGFSKNRYIGRTFIQPTQKLREQGVAMKFNILKEAIEGKNIIVVDDSIVRGTTTGPLIKMLKKAGAKQVHIRIASPPVRFPCFMGVDMGEPKNLIAHNKSIEEILEHIGADSLAYLTKEKMLKAMKQAGAKTNFCCACFDGKYPIDVSQANRKDSFEN